MNHTFETQLARSTREKDQSSNTPWIMRFIWKADGILIESGEYTLPELEKLMREMSNKLKEN